MSTYRCPRCGRLVGTSGVCYDCIQKSHSHLLNPTPDLVGQDPQLCPSCGRALPPGSHIINGRCAACYGLTPLSNPLSTPLNPATPDLVGQDSVVEANVLFLRSRSLTGLRKYGTTLDRTDLTVRDWFNHAMEEAADLLNYLRKLTLTLHPSVLDTPCHTHDAPAPASETPSTATNSPSSSTSPPA